MGLKRDSAGIRSSAASLSIVSMTGALAIAKVLAHCGGSPDAAVSFIVRAVAADPADVEPYSALEELRRELPAEVAGVVATANTVGPVVARAYLSFVDGDMDEAAMSLGSVTGFQPEVPWATAPWFGDDRFLGAVTAAAFAEGTMRIRDYGRDLESDAVLDAFTELAPPGSRFLPPHPARLRQQRLGLPPISARTGAEMA